MVRRPKSEHPVCETCGACILYRKEPTENTCGFYDGGIDPVPPYHRFIKPWHVQVGDPCEHYITVEELRKKRVPNTMGGDGDMTYGEMLDNLFKNKD